MIVVKLIDGSLWVDSPVAATCEEAAQLEGIGSVAHLVSPAPLHDWRLKRWIEFFPLARAWKASAVGKRRRRLGEESLRKLLSWDFDKIVIAHGNLAVDNARSLVERSFRWL